MKIELNRFLEGLQIKQLSELQLNNMGEPIRQEEINLAIIKKYIAPGMDGFTSEFYNQG